MLWSINETRRLNELQAQKKTVEEIEEIMKIPQLDIINKLISMGFKPLHKKPENKRDKPEQTSLFKTRKERKSPTPEIEEKVVKFRQRGFNYEEIAGFTGISASSVGRVLKRHGFPSNKRFYGTKEQAPLVVEIEATKKPAPDATGASPENIKSQEYNNTKTAICKDLLKEAKTTLESAEPRKTFNSIGKALGYIEAALKLMEVKK